MSEMSFEQMLDAYEKTIRNGEVVEGTVIDVKPDEIVLNIGYKSDAMIVIGNSNSINTQKLFEICKKECENTYYVQTSNDMDYTKLKSINNVGITAGASTPNNIIEEVSKNVRNEL